MSVDIDKGVPLNEAGVEPAKFKSLVLVKLGFAFALPFSKPSAGAVPEMEAAKSESELRLAEFP